MISFYDDLIWGVIGNKGFCSFKFLSKGQNFCKNEYNVSGFCSKQSCPLSNSKYATIIEKNGEFFLYIKSNINLRYPDRLWKKFMLDNKNLQINFDLLQKLFNKELSNWREEFTQYFA